LRGFRILADAANTDKMHALLNEKPNNVYISLDEFTDIARSASYFPPLLLMEFLEGEEYSVDILVNDGKAIEIIPRSRDKIKMGISFAGTLVRDEEIIRYSKSIVESLQLHGNIGLQFRKDAAGIPKLLESNPRVQGTIVFNTAGGFNMVYNAVKMAKGEEIVTQEIKWGMRMIRFWDEIYLYQDQVVKI
jgi:carbamoyl-phosphate synthase large subunit